MFSSLLWPGHGNRLVAVVVEGLECCSSNRPRLKFFRGKSIDFAFHGEVRSSYSQRLDYT
jgi:hypothetical protein